MGCWSHYHTAEQTAMPPTNLHILLHREPGHTQVCAPGCSGSARKVGTSGDSASSVVRCRMRVKPTILSPPGWRCASLKVPYMIRFCGEEREAESAGLGCKSTAGQR